MWILKKSYILVIKNFLKKSDCVFILGNILGNFFGNIGKFKENNDYMMDGM